MMSFQEENIAILVGTLTANGEAQDSVCTEFAIRRKPTIHLFSHLHNNVHGRIQRAFRWSHH